LLQTKRPADPAPTITGGPDAGWAGGKGGLSVAVAEKELSQLKLGEALSQAIATIGTPWMVVYQSPHSYWMYRTDAGHAWLVLGVQNGRVDSAQISLYAHDSSTVKDSANIRLGGPGGQVHGGRSHRAQAANDQVVELPSNPSGHVFYGIDRSNRVDRLGRTLGNYDLAAYARWYEFDGQGPDHPLPATAYGGTASGERLYISRLDEPYLPCSGGNQWRILSQHQSSFAGVAIAALHLQCGNTPLTRLFYIATTAALPRAFDVDARSEAMLRGTIESPANARVSPGATIGQIWSITPNGTRFQNSDIDIHIQYIDDPNNPLTEVTAYQVPLSDTSQAGSQGGSGSGFSFSCSFGSGGGKCTAVDLPDGQVCVHIEATFGTTTPYTVFSGTECHQDVADPVNFSSHPGLLGATGCSGGPVNAVSGNLWYQYQDFQLSGPFGLSLSHRYDSTLATTGYKSDLGVGWISNYGPYLDISNVSAYGVVTLHDGDCNKIYLQSLGSGTSSYEQFTGDILYTEGGGTYRLVTWDNRTFVFQTYGQGNIAQLTSITDRIGNLQTINRNTNGQITTIVDTLGRSLTFSYNTAGQIQSIVSGPAPSFVGATVSFTYGTSAGTNNCYTGDLCTVRESDGSVWTYEYYQPTSDGYHLLEYVIDPLGHTEENNQYTKVDFGTGDDNYRVSTQSIDNGVNTYSYAYSLNGSDGTTTVTDNANENHLTTYGWDEYLQQVTSVSGYLCFCNGDSLMYNYDIFGRPNSVQEGGSPDPTVAAQYGRDQLFRSPNGDISYVLLAYPSITQLQQFNIFTSAGFQTKNTQLAYYAIGDPRQDLPQTVTEPSVDTPGASVVTTYTFTTKGLATAISRSGYSGGTEATYTISATYDLMGRIETLVGPRTDVNQETTVAYYPNSDADFARRGQLMSIEDALDHTSSFATAASPYNTYSIYGGPKSATDPNGVVTDLSYDQRGRTQQLILNGVSGDPTNLVTAFAYNTLGELLSITRPLLNSLTAAYDSANRRTALTILDSSGKQREQFAMAYNTVSQLLTQSAQSCSTPASTCTTWQTAMSQTLAYASAGTLSSISNAAGGQTSFSWDAYGNNTGVVAGVPSGFQYTTTNAFDPSHLLMTTRLSGSVSTAYTHDFQGNLTRTISPSTAAASSYFDDFGCLRKEISTYTGTVVQTCDRAGNVTSSTDANGAVTTATYDALNRPLTQTSTRSGSPTETVTCAYDNTSSGAFGVGRLASMTDPSGSASYTYERRGFPSSVSKAINGAVYLTTYKYDGNGNQIQSQLSANAGAPFTLTYTYDYADRPLSVVSGSTAYVSQAVYEPMGPRSQLTYGNGTQQVITYDQGYRPTEAKVTNGSATLSDLLYTVNSAGYVTQVTDNLNSGYNQAFTYGGKATNALTLATTGTNLWGRASYSDTLSQNLQTANLPTRNLTYGYNRVYQLQSINQVGSGTQAIAHDAMGNETGVGASMYTYSARELLNSGDGISYTYDGGRHRVIAESSAGTRASLYDSKTHLQAESSLTSGSLAYNYVWFGGTPVAQVDTGGSTHWTVTDERGAAFMQTAASGNVYWQADYEPFGAIYDERTSDVHQPLRLPGQEAEEFSTSEGPNGASGRFYNAFRWYRPQYGRYTQPDPLGYLGSTYNLYSYANNSPFNYVDPLGLDDCFLSQGPPSWLEPVLLGVAIGALLFSGFGIAALGLDLAGIAVFGDAAEAATALGPAVGAQPWAGAIAAGPVPEGGLVAFRIWGGATGLVGTWFSPLEPESATVARSIFSLPPGNTAQWFTAVFIPAGTQIQFGTAAANFGELGGGVQIQVLGDLAEAGLIYGQTLPFGSIPLSLFFGENWPFASFP
jgi:RHS repeat-associated protein